MAEPPRRLLYIWRRIPEFFAAINKSMESRCAEDHRQFMKMYIRYRFLDTHGDYDLDAIELGKWNIPWEVTRRVHIQKVDGKNMIVDTPPNQTRTQATTAATQQTHAQQFKPGEPLAASELSDEFLLVHHSKTPIRLPNYGAGSANAQTASSSALDVNLGKLHLSCGNGWDIYIAEFHLEPGNEERGGWRFPKSEGYEDLISGSMFEFMRGFVPEQEGVESLEEVEVTASSDLCEESENDIAPLPDNFDTGKSGESNEAEEKGEEASGNEANGNLLEEARLQRENKKRNREICVMGDTTNSVIAFIGPNFVDGFNLDELQIWD